LSQDKEIEPMAQTKNHPTFKDLADADLEGVVRCYCGCKYWEDLRCVDCGDKVNLELYLQLADAYRAFEGIS
jgi:hypothetical protein